MAPTDSPAARATILPELRALWWPSFTASMTRRTPSGTLHLNTNRVIVSQMAAAQDDWCCADKTLSLPSTLSTWSYWSHYVRNVCCVWAPALVDSTECHATQKNFKATSQPEFKTHACGVLSHILFRRSSPADWSTSELQTGGFSQP